MATLRPELKQILDRYGIDPRDKAQLWDCHGTLVLYHRAYEIIAAKEGIQFEPPQVIEGNGEKKVVSLLVIGRMGDRSEWSFGEAVPANCKNAYPYATAEKRAKDRVIAKLVGLAQYVYSEDEADEFKDGPHRPVAEGAARVRELVATPAPPPDLKALAEKIIRGINAAPYVDALDSTMDITMVERQMLPAVTRRHIDRVYTLKREQLENAK